MKAFDCAEISMLLASQMDSTFRIESEDLGCRVMTPFLYPNNEPIEVFVAPSLDGLHIEVTDRGGASDNVFLSGVGSTVVRNQVDLSTRRFGLNDDGSDELAVVVPTEQLVESVWSVINAANDVGYLVYKANKRESRATFEHQVESFFIERGRTFRRRVDIPGTHHLVRIDYAVNVPGSQTLMTWLLDSRNESAANNRADLINGRYFQVAPMLSQSLWDFAVLVNTGSQFAQSGGLDRALATLESGGPKNIIRWNRNELLDQLLVA